MWQATSDRRYDGEGDGSPLEFEEFYNTVINYGWASVAFNFDNSWLERQTSLEELGDDFGQNQAKWDALKSQMIAGDELWTYGKGSGLACEWGIALRRNGRVISKIVRMQS